MTTLINSLGPFLGSMGNLMTTIAGVLFGTGSLLSMNVETFHSGMWMLNGNPYAADPTVQSAVAFMGGNMSMSTAAFTVVSKPLVEAGGPIVTNLSDIVAKMPAVLTALQAFFTALVNFMSA